MGDVITTLHQVDPAFRELVDLLYKSGAGPDGSELHVPGGGLRRRPPPGRRLVRAGTLTKANPIKNLARVGELHQGLAAQGRALGQLKADAAHLSNITGDPSWKQHPGKLHLARQAANAKLNRKIDRKLLRNDIADAAMAHGQKLLHNVQHAVTAAPEPGWSPAKKAAAVAGGGAAAGGLAVHQSNKNKMNKSAELASVTWTGTISKIDTDKRQVFGYCSVSEVNGTPVVDLQGDWVPIEEVEKAAYNYMLASRAGGDMHKRVSKLAADEPLRTGEIIESFVITKEKLDALGIPDGTVPLGWWLGFQVHDDDAWAAIKSGQRTGFSLHGTGKRREVEL